MSFDKIFDLTAGVYFNFHNIYIEACLECGVFVDLRAAATTAAAVHANTTDMDGHEASFVCSLLGETRARPSPCLLLSILWFFYVT